LHGFGGKFKSQKVVLQPFSWRCIERAIHYKWDVHEEQHPYICDTNKQ